MSVPGSSPSGVRGVLGTLTSPSDGNGASRAIRIVLALGMVILVGVVVLFILSNTPIFTITSIEAEGTDHVTAEAISKLVKVDEGTTLLNVDTDSIAASVKKNPWVGSVNVVREFPDKIDIVVTERSVGAVVLMSSGNIAWYLSSDGTWIEPFNIDSNSTSSSADIAGAKAKELGCLLITDVPATVVPQAGSATSDDCIQAVLQYQSQFSSDFASQIASYSASNADAISCTLNSGVLISLGAASNISTKETVINSIIGQYGSQVTYINVRVPSSPTYRKVDTGNVTSGEGDSSSTDATSTDAASADAASTEAASTDAASTDATGGDEGSSSDGSQ